MRAGGAVDLLVTGGRSMPGMTGCELIAAAAPLRPSMPAMLITGYDKASGPDQFQGRVAILCKPFRRSALPTQVQALPGRAAGAVNMNQAALPATPDAAQRPVTSKVYGWAAVCGG